jgi:hypothetical protein
MLSFSIRHLPDSGLIEPTNRSIHDGVRPMVHWAFATLSLALEQNPQVAFLPSGKRWARWACVDAR